MYFQQKAQRNPVVSIVIPCYNYAHFLPEAIDSALGQTYANIEVLVIDDGSQDDTQAIAASYGDRIQYFWKPNAGLSHTRNYGIQSCKGAYIVFLDADNWLKATFVEACLQRIAVRHTSFVYTQLRHFGHQNYVTKHPHYDVERLKRGNYIDACALLKTELAQRYPYDEANRTGWEDWDFYLTLAEHGYYGALVDEPLLWYRQHADNMTNKLEILNQQQLRVAIMRRHLAFVGLKTYFRHWLRLHRLQLHHCRGSIDHKWRLTT
ncbi:glycosyltransferase [soil metagenome]